MSETIRTAILLDSIVTEQEGIDYVRSLVTSAPEPIAPEALDVPGAPEGAIVFALGVAEAQRSADRQRFAASAFRSTASRNALALIAKEQFGVTVQEADYATTPIVLTNNSNSQYGPFPAGELRIVNSSTDPKTIYVNQDEVTIYPGPWTSEPIGAQAIEPGSGSNSGPGDLDSLETPLEGVTVTNSSPAYGNDDESSESIQRKIEAKIGGLNMGGTDSSFESIARNGIDGGGGVLRPDGSRVTVTRTAVVRDDATGTVTLYVADDDGPLTVSDLGYVTDEVQAYAEWIGLEVDVENPVAVPIAVTYTMTVDKRTSATDQAIEDDNEASLVASLRLSRIGGFDGFIPQDYIREALAAGRDGPVTWRTIKVVLTSPSSDTAIAANELPTLGAVTGTIVRG